MKKIFTNDKFFLAAVLFAVLGNGIYAILALCATEFALSSPIIGQLIRVLCAIFLYSSYKKHSKNVMKGLMGAMLMAQLILSIDYLSQKTLPIDGVCMPVVVVLSALLFINHFIINSDHHSSPAMVRLNQIIAVLLIVNEIVWSGTWVAVSFSPLYLIAAIMGILGFIGFVGAVVCVESRLDAYRLERENAGWTEEKGYPENYVHEYEKK